MSISRLTFQVDAASRKQKLGDYLFDNIRDLSKMYLRELIKTGKCEVNGSLVNSGYRLRERDFIEIEADLSRGTAMQPENIALDIVFEDDELIVVNKPAGMLVHPSHRDRNGTLLNALVFHVNKGVLRAVPVDVRKGYAFPVSDEKDQAAAPPDQRHSRACDGSSDGKAQPFRSSDGEAAFFIRPGLPHRLDRQTSGLIVAAKTARAHRTLSGHFMRKRVEKRYLALVESIVADDEGTIDAPIGRFAEHKHWTVKEDGKHSRSRYWVRERFSDTTLLELEPVTGRTNQLRIHCEMIGHPIVGDTRRGGREFERLCLHASKLSFPHPVSGERMEFQRDAPVDFALPSNPYLTSFSVSSCTSPTPGA